ncbi:uncharacterized protein TRAVEDRAFT_76230, partial [Trametes versicolor FP-101664 SS1]|uniref:uncharacterized protein n=1 Tax=Trametes versicolor (strain FP-101664) TaxID=717944 RepID=UPI00046220DB
AARRVMTKVVNALSVMRHIGGPAACSYLLGIPDHYTNDMFKVFYWYGYVRRVLSDTDRLVGSEYVQDSSEKVMVAVNDYKVVGLNKVNDYIFRPKEFDSWTLYDYMCLTRVQRGKVVTKRSDMHDNLSRYEFLSDHPLSRSHYVCMLPDAHKFVLNFCGPVLPRRDSGDREMYCATMLTFFCPGGWRSGEDLVCNDNSWSVIFDSTVFSDDHLRIMNNMNVLYECLDARDDYSALRRSEQFNGGMNVDGKGYGIDDSLLGDVDVDNMMDDMRELMGDGLEYNNPEHVRKMREINYMKRVLNSYGYGDCAKSGPETGEVLNDYNVPLENVNVWSLRVAEAKQLVVSKRNNDVPDVCKHAGRAGEIRMHESRDNSYVDNVYVLTKKDLQTKLVVDKPIQDSAILMVSDTIVQFSLNQEQIRAFMIIAGVVQHRDRSQLKMYVGGMAGTGKSQVLRALTSLMRLRGEAYRLFLMAPTGSSACIIDGSTYHSALGLGR